MVPQEIADRSKWLNRVPVNPVGPDLWRGSSDVDWIRGDEVYRSDHQRSIAQLHPWYVANRVFAEAMVRANRAHVLNIVDALISWQTCTVSQLQGGLAVGEVPTFTRDVPNLYGALVRLGALNVGFARYERVTGEQCSETWVTLGNRAKLVKDLLKLVSADQWQHKMYAENRVVLSRPHARHNTIASHVGLMLSRDPRVQFTNGDGYGGFRYIDRLALDESGMERMSCTDVLAMCDNNVFAGIEVQVHADGTEQKMRNWARFLAHSPMQRRGLVCVFLFVKDTQRGAYPAVSTAVEHVGGMAEMMMGEPSVAARLGWARWEDWFDEQTGQPVERFGSYTDMLGAARSLFDEHWRSVTPVVRDPRVVRDWGWENVRRQLSAEWGVDPSQWVLPEQWRGGFTGFTCNNRAHRRRFGDQTHADLYPNPLSLPGEGGSHFEEVDA